MVYNSFIADNRDKKKLLTKKIEREIALHELFAQLLI